MSDVASNIDGMKYFLLLLSPAALNKEQRIHALPRTSPRQAVSLNKHEGNKPTD